MTAVSGDGAKHQRARLMARVAGGLLVVMAGVFVLAHHMAAGGGGPGSQRLWGYVLAFAEAAMVGGLADWFAVTALFRRPLGLPIPHTAIIPANKDRIADAMANFLRTHFLTPQVVARRLRPINLAALVGGFLADPARLQAALRGGRGALAEIVPLFATPEIGRLTREALTGQLARLDVAGLAGQVLDAAIANERHGPMLDAALRWAGTTLEANEALLRDIIHQRAGSVLRWTGLDEQLASAILDGLYRLLAECIVDPEHPMRRKLEAGLVDLAARLQTDPALRAKIAHAQAQVLPHPAVAAWLESLWERARLALLRMIRGEGGALSGQMGAAMAAWGRTLIENPAAQQAANRHTRRLLTGLAVRHGGAIVMLVSATIRRWDGATVAARIEGAVGRDLQFIRINGTLVGGLVGVVLHSLAGLW